MGDRRQFVLAGVFLIAITAWLIAAPTTALPVGVLATDGESMGDEPDDIYLNIWVDKEPEIGDVVIFEQDGELASDIVAHRVIENTESGAVTKGDANSFVDQDIRGVDHVTNQNRYGMVVFRLKIENAIFVAAISIIAAFLHSVIMSRR
ncbi:S24/S26 family peptidase (plasmid) [Natrialbaceae archaeon A-CW2]